MTENTAEPTQKKKLQDLVLYSLVDLRFIQRNIYVFSEVQPSAKHIAHQYDCDLEFRDAEYNILVANPRFLPIHELGRGIAAVLVGESREKLERARNDIHRTFGRRHLYGSVSVGRERGQFGYPF
ncbi:hypothetical protein HYV50_03570 [Candidatus Pacearchaeota archaeon]|nr:hypothetical protein [Candidatus Pacearchaeota archaeon]